MRMRIFLTLLLVLGFSSCSKLSIGVYWADTFALSKIDDFFTLNSEQKQIVKKDFQLAFQEVRRTEFPLLADLLEEIAQEVEKKSFDEAKIEKWNSRSIELVKQGAKRFEPLGQKLMEWQAPLGFARFDEAFFKSQEKKSKTLIASEDRLQQAKKRIERMVDETLGFLQPSQEGLVKGVLAENPLVLEHESRKFSFEKFQKARGQPKDRSEYVRKYFYDWDSLQSAEYLSARNAYQKKGRALILQILNSADDAQRKNLMENFRDRASQLRELSHVGKS
jgi:hypothetical protein